MSTPIREQLSTLETATPIAAHVFVDFELRGCPVNQYQLLEVVSALLVGPKAEHLHAQPVRRVQAARAALRAGLRRPALPGANHANRLRRLVPGHAGGPATAASAPWSSRTSPRLGSWFTRGWAILPAT